MFAIVSGANVRSACLSDGFCHPGGDQVSSKHFTYMRVMPAAVGHVQRVLDQAKKFCERTCAHHKLDHCIMTDVGLAAANSDQHHTWHAANASSRALRERAAGAAAYMLTDQASSEDNNFSMSVVHNASFLPRETILQPETIVSVTILEKRVCL